MGIETEEQLYRFIAKEEKQIDYRHLNRINETAVACGDPLIQSRAAWRLVGGVVKLHLNGFLLPYVSKREGKGGVLEGHLACGWMFTQGYQTYEAQSGLIVAAREEVQDLNKQFGTSFVIPEPHRHGSAAPFMIDSDLYR
ncbi:hypothetical protein A2714_04020 [Candidatus Woesebacteria bacterium RIFCSPHIGHO2_01_FULL_38_9]|uniref:Uncharacterized protein n=2 Tax=Candidatus Woeseibacteriota TaxID=1752722 RepID=A0A1F7Y1I9_9BACT|nr:MAG: hypothetical protein A2714_04020 [Candidatus Woesebacteria bacterium RIFCSPHIGHO2_01_FULL_38_9]OGM60077.1 MAG: hypothetical protein A3A75_01585 [Candidatus Woesebacteria bacterium RIFCSPLOWO2_01_FULL_39_10]